MSPPSSIKSRLESINRFSNVKLDYVKRLYDRRPIEELYACGAFELHIHFAGHGMWCATYLVRKAVEIGVAPPYMASCHNEVPSNRSEFPVFVSIRKVAEDSESLASVVRLQNLDFCDMCLANAFEPARFYASREILFLVHDRKLRELLHDVGIVQGEGKDQIIKSTPKIVAHFPDQNTDTHGGKKGIIGGHVEYIRGIRIELADNGIFLFPAQIGEPEPQIRKVFACPRYSFECAIEGMRQHEIIPE